MCDLAVTKTGYSTASGAIRAKVPMFFLKRDGFQEDELIGDRIYTIWISILVIIMISMIDSKAMVWIIFQ